MGSGGKAERSQILKVIASKNLHEANAEMILGIATDESTEYDLSRGTYRSLGFAGEENAPSEVMVELLAPFTSGNRKRWLIIGGVVSWENDAWCLFSMLPREVPEADVSDSVEAVLNSLSTKEPFHSRGWYKYRTGT